jgi:hypothetical protein
MRLDVHTTHRQHRRPSLVPQLPQPPRLDVATTQKTGETTMTYLDTDQYIRIRRGCPMTVELHKMDGFVEIILGEERFSGSCLRLQIQDPDTCTRFRETIDDAQNQLLDNTSANPRPDSAAPQPDNDLTAPIAG